MAGALPEGSIGALSYANTILGAFYSVGISLSIAVFPTLSRMAAMDDMENTGRTVTTSLRLLIFILAPLTFLLIPFAAPTVGLLLGRGRFDVVAVDRTSYALAMYAVGLIAIAGLYVLQRAFNALRDYVTPFIIGAAVMIAHIVLNVLLMPALLHGGIALSASLCNIAGVAALTILLARRVPQIELGGLTMYLLQCGVVAAIITVIIAWSFAATNIGAATLIARAVGVAFAVVGGLIYLGAAFVLRVPESKMLINLALGFMRRSERGAGQ
jgi:putative peptidoglycan lipid II flippase